MGQLVSLVESIGVDTVRIAVQERIAEYVHAHGHRPRCLFISTNLFEATIQKDKSAWCEALCAYTFEGLRIFIARPFASNPEQVVILEVT